MFQRLLSLSILRMRLASLSLIQPSAPAVRVRGYLDAN